MDRPSQSRIRTARPKYRRFQTFLEPSARASFRFGIVTMLPGCPSGSRQVSRKPIAKPRARVQRCGLPGFRSSGKDHWANRRARWEGPSESSPGVNLRFGGTGKEMFNPRGTEERARAKEHLGASTGRESTTMKKKCWTPMGTCGLHGVGQVCQSKHEARVRCF